MTLELALLNRKELRQAAELATRAFCDYEYFTIWFPDPEEQARMDTLYSLYQRYTKSIQKVGIFSHATL